MKSPLNKSSNVSLINTINKEWIITQYKKNYNIDVSNYFQTIENIEVYRCDETGYKFYFPLNLGGNSEFYIHFQKFTWYYMPWKWEHSITYDLIKQGDKILEVGCGQGAFLKKIVTQKNIECVGVEMNKSAVYDAPNLKIINSSIEEFSSLNENIYDLVCSFQVIEHISEVNSFIYSKIKSLKPGGSLIICVPNNDSIIFKGIDHDLNMPPHHMGLWNTESLTSLERIFDIKLEKIFYEPLQDYHFNLYEQIVLGKKIKNKILVKIILKIKKIFAINSNLNKIANEIHGNSILAHYKKNH
jgi:2-polyprenyl-3-methyl-5-hydroxy-6-metoxy-1,4-benzoquinol methylase